MTKGTATSSDEAAPQIADVMGGTDYTQYSEMVFEFIGKETMFVNPAGMVNPGGPTAAPSQGL